MENDLLVASLNYAAQGFSIIPVGQNKRPLLGSWKQYQNVRATPEEILKWWKQWPAANIGLVTGAISGLIVVDIEKGGDVSGLSPTVISRSGGGGWHYFYKHPGSIVANVARIRPLTDIRGDGGYVVMPPSIHASGGQYKWAVGFGEIELAEYPEELFQKIVTPTPAQLSIWKGVPEGMRNASAASVAGTLLARIPTDLWEITIGPALSAWNSHNTPPLPENELRAVYCSIANKELQKRLRPATTRQRKPFSVSELLTMDVPEQPFIVESLIPENGISTLSGYPESGKSWVIIHVAHCVATGQPVFGKFATKQGAVLIVDEEAGAGEFKRRITMLGLEPDIPIHFFTQEEFKIDREDNIRELLQTVRDYGIKLIIFDPFSAIHGKTENNAEEMQRVMEALQQFCKIGATVVFIHHHRKENSTISNPQASMSLRGSSVLFSRIDAHLAVKKNSESEEKVEITIEPVKLRRGLKLKPFKIELNTPTSGEVTSFAYAGNIKEQETQIEKAKEAIILLLKEATEPLPMKQIISALHGINIGKTNTENAMKDLRNAMRVTGASIEGKGNKKYFQLSTTEYDDEDDEDVDISSQLPLA